MGRMRKGESEKTSIFLHLEPEVKYILSSTVRETSSHNIGHKLGLILQQETAHDQGASQVRLRRQRSVYIEILAPNVQLSYTPHLTISSLTVFPSLVTSFSSVMCLLKLGWVLRLR